MEVIGIIPDFLGNNKNEVIVLFKASSQYMKLLKRCAEIEEIPFSEFFSNIFKFYEEQE